jgi:hypothetical protein
MWREEGRDGATKELGANLALTRHRRSSTMLRKSLAKAAAPDGERK